MEQNKSESFGVEDPEEIKRPLGDTEHPQYTTFQKYDDPEFRLDCTSIERLERERICQERMDEFTTENPDLYRPLRGTIYESNCIPVMRDFIIPRFVEMTQGKSLRIEALANILFAIVNDLEKDETVIYEDNTPSHLSSITVKMSMGNVKSYIYRDPQGLGALINSLIPDDQFSHIRKALYAVISYDPDFCNDLSKLESTAEKNFC